MASERTTLKKIAAKAEVHPTTVSLALRNHPSIPEKTRNRLKKIADEMGYIPDPMLASLNAYRHQNIQKKYLSKIAWLNICVDEEWPNEFFIREYFTGAKRRANQLGFDIESFCAHPSKIPTPRLQKILMARSIQGLIIAPLHLSSTEGIQTLDLDWENFSAITFGYTFKAPPINRVTSNHYDAMMKVLKKLKDYGYKRPGLFVSEIKNLRVYQLWEAGYLAGMHTIFKQTPLLIELFESYESKDARFLKWYGENNPDVVITQAYTGIESCLLESDINIPEDCGVVHLEESNLNFACIKENNEQIGEIAIAQLVGAMHQNVRGIPVVPSITLVEPTWHDGCSLVNYTEQQ